MNTLFSSNLSIHYCFEIHIKERSAQYQSIVISIICMVII